MFGLRSARGRAILAATVLVLLVVGMGALAIWRAREDGQLHDTLGHQSSTAADLASAEAGFWQAQGALSALVISGDPALVDDYDSALATAGQDLAKARAEFLAMGEADKVAALDDLTGRIEEFNQTVRWLFQTIIEADRESVIDLANSSMLQMTATNTATIADLEEMVQEAQQDESAEREAADDAADFTLWLLLGLSGVALAAGIGTVVMLVGSVVGPLAALRASARAIASGDFEGHARVFGPEEVASLARDFNEMTDALAAKTQTVQESERRYRLLAENASDVIWIMDMNLRLTYESPSVRRIRGYSPEEAMAQTMEETLTPASLDVAMKVLAEELAIAKAEQMDLSRSRTLELEHYCKDGSTVWLEVTTTFLRDEDGRPVGILGASRDITERKRAEEALQESERQYRLLAENASDHVWTMDLGLRYTYVSPSVTRMRGYTVEEALRGGIAQTLTPASLEIARKILAEELAEERTGAKDPFRSRSLEVEMNCRDGSTIWTEVSVTFLRDPDGQPVGILGVTRDISERKQAEEALRESEERFRRLADASLEGIAINDKGKIVDANAALARMFGREPSELIGMLASDLVAPGSRELVMQRALSGDEQPYEAVGLRKDGATFWIEVCGKALPYSGRLLRVTAVRDISERKRAEDALRESEESYRELVENINEIIYTVDSNGVITYISPVVEQLAGYTPSEVIGRPFTEFVHPDDISPLMRSFQETFAGNLEAFEYRVLTKSGETRWVRTSSRPVLEGDRIVSFHAVLTDITERKRAEEALRESEARYKALFAGAPEGMLVADLQTRQFRYANPAMCSMFGYTEEEFLRIGVADIHPKESLDHVLAEFEAQARGEKVFSPGLPCLRKDGTSFYANISAVTTVLDGRKCNVGIFSDVTEQKRAEEALRETRDYLEKLIDHANAPIIVWDPRFTITRFNDAFERLTGRPASDVLGQRLEVLFPEPERAASMEKIARTLRGEFWELIEIPILHQSGEVRQVLWNSANITGADGRTVVATIAQGTDVSERKRAEETLRESEARYKALFAGAPVGMLVADVQTRQFRYANPVVCRMFGYTEEEFLRIGVADMSPKESLDQMLAGFEAALRGEKPSSPGLPCLRKDGTLFYADISGITMILDGRQCLVGIFTDISERKRAEEALRESEERTRLIVETAHDAFISVDASGAITAWNAQAEKTFGWAAAEATGRTLAETIIPPQHRQAHTRGFNHTLATGEGPILNKSVEITALHRDGHEFPAELAVWVVGSGETSTFNAFVRDISERKRAEETLRESESKYRTLVENIPQKVFFKDRNSVYVSCNGDYARDLSLNPDEIAGKTDYDFYPRELADKYRADDKRVMQSGETEDIEEEYVQDGRQAFIHTVKTPVKDEDGSVVGVLGVFWDVTERKRAEEERERLHAELEVRAITDGLTGLYNHAHFFQRLSEETERSGRYNHGFAVAMMDVDNFKKFNDSRGHQQGDKILRLVADSIRSGLRRSDLAFRYGGDEFAAIMLHADAARARTVIDRINRHLARNLKQMNDEAASRVSLSAGVACFGHDGRTADELALVADTNLYSAKWAARARSAAGEEYAIQSLAAPPGTSEMGLPSNTVGSLATVLRELGVPDALAELNLRTIAALGTLAEVRDPYIRGHQERTSEVAVSVAEEMGLSSDRVRGIRLAGLLHDLGKAGVSKRILNKPGKLTEEEFAEIKEHPPLGSMMIISEIEALQQVVPIVRHHHEHFDGKGYPDGLAGQDIPLEARILGVVDAFDAMTHERSYRKAMSKEEALAELERGAGTQFDPAVVEAFLALAPTEGERLPARKQPAKDDKEPAALPTA